jgi:hypothetical protein
VDRLVEAVAELQRPGALDQHFEETLPDGAVENEAAGRRAPLTGGAEGTPQHAVEREVEVRVFEHDLRVLSAELERHALQGLAARLTDLPSHLRRSATNHERRA